MTQQIFDNGMTAHVWAQQTQENGRSHNGNLFFSGRSIYSYGPHYVAGYVAPGPLYLVNGDDSTMTTKCKHLPAVWRAIDYGRGAFDNHATIPDLNSVAHIFDALCCNAETKAGAQKRLVRQFEYDPQSWPGVEAAARCYVAAGMTPSKAQAKAEAGDSRVKRAAHAAKVERAKEIRDEQAAEARGIFENDSPAEAAADVRHTLSKAAGESQWQAERLEQEAAEGAREYHRAAKAAKAKGWTRIAAHCFACHRAARAEIKRYEQGRARYQERAALRNAIAEIRDMPRAVADMTPNHFTGRAYNETETAAARRRAESYARGWGELSASLSLVAVSRYAVATLPPATRSQILDKAQQAAALQQAYQARAGELVQHEQAERRAAWLAGDNSGAGWGAGRLQDSEGGALLRAENVERDDAGQITGGTLRTSWAATVPLVHAIRAFQFLKLCRERGQGWAANGRTIRVGHFRVDRIDESGNLWAACHRINWQEVERLAGLLGVLGMTAADSALEPSRGAA